MINSKVGEDVEIKSKNLIINISPYEEKNLLADKRIKDLSLKEFIGLTFLKEFNDVLDIYERDKERVLNLKKVVEHSKVFVKKFGYFTVKEFKQSAERIVYHYKTIKRMFNLKGLTIQFLVNPHNYKELVDCLHEPVVSWGKAIYNNSEGYEKYLEAEGLNKITW